MTTRIFFYYSPLRAFVITLGVIFFMTVFGTLWPGFVQAALLAYGISLLFGITLDLNLLHEDPAEHAIRFFQRQELEYRKAWGSPSLLPNILSKEFLWEVLPLFLLALWDSAHEVCHFAPFTYMGVAIGLALIPEYIRLLWRVLYFRDNIFTVEQKPA